MIMLKIIKLKTFFQILNKKSKNLNNKTIGNKNKYKK